MIYTYVQNLNAISSTSEDPESGLKFLNWLYASEENHDLFHYGIEGTHYTKTGDHRIEQVKGDDGNYTAPSADVILSYVRNKILLDAAEDEGITVSSKEMKKYAEDSIGTSDYKTMATQYGVSKDQAKQIVRQSATLQKLYKKKVGDSSASMPTAPTEPADGNEETASKDYADYIINLAGDEWDSSKGTWKDADSTYAKAFADDAFTTDSATYKQAMTAYYTAYQQYSSQASSASSKWTEYANGLYAKANISIYGLFA